MAHSEMDDGFDAWDRERFEEGDERTPFTVKERILAAGRARIRETRRPVPKDPYAYPGLKIHPHYNQANKMRWYNRLTCFLALASLILAIIQNEIHWESYRTIEPDTPEMGPIYIPEHNPPLRELLKWIVGINILVLEFGIYLYYRASLRLEKLRGTMLPQDTFYSAGYLPYWLLETLICAIHPLPFLYFEFDKPERGGLHTTYTSDDFFTALMLPRLYLLFRVFRDFYGLNHENCRHIGIFGGVDLDRPMVLFKNMLFEHPVLVIPIGVLLNIFTLGYAMCVFERPTDASFLKIKNGFWVTFVTMTTVGYGDLYPQTDFGRLIAVLACTQALIILMLCIIGLDAFLEPDPKEFKAFDVIKHKDWNRELKMRAIVLIQSFWRSIRLLDRKDTPLSFGSSYIADTKLSTLIRRFRDFRRCEPLQHDNVGMMAWHEYTICRDLGSRIQILEDALLQNQSLREEYESDRRKGLRAL